MEKRILTAGPYVDNKEVEYVLDAVKNGWNENWNKYIVKFEQEFAKYVGAKYSMCTSSCTGALHLALLTLNIGKGDEVIVPDMTWVATATPVLYVGANPVFVDIDPDSWTIDPDCIEKAVTDKTKAIIPVHLYGHPSEMDRIMDIAEKHNLYIIEDAAPSVGAEFKGKRTGSFGDFSAFSFQGAKVLVTGEGGMLVTNNKEYHDTAFNINDHGRDPKIPFWINRIGYKYKMSNLQAAFGLGQLEKIDYLIECKRRIFHWYQERLGHIKEIKLNHELKEKGAKSIYWMTSILLGDDVKISREDLMRRLDKEFSIDSRPVFPKLSKFPMFNECNNPVSDKVSGRALNLPSGVCLTEQDVERVCNAVKKILNVK